MKPRAPGVPNARSSLSLVLLAGLAVVVLGGCGRAFYRQQADREVAQLVDCASGDPRWPLDHFTIQPDPCSRMFDPFGPDLPPMPPDDPTSHRLMHCVDCRPGAPCWRCYGTTNHVENPDWRAALPTDDQGQVVLDRTAAVRLALLHSPDYQRELEDLYLSALDVTLERFRLDAQFFGGNSTFFTADGPDRAGGAGSELRTDSHLQMRKLFATGGELVVGMANSLVWQFAGPDGYSANTLLDFSLVQPLLRAGGRAVVLESLTQAERALLANIRQLERFRRGFCVQVMVGRAGLPGPIRGGVGFDGVSFEVVRSAGGFLSLLEQQVRIRNQRANVARLRTSLERMEAFHQSGRISSQQVGITRQGLYDAQSALLALRAEYEANLDQYKLTLGLPPQLELKIEDPLLARFDLIDPQLSDTQDEVSELLGELREALESGETGVSTEQLGHLKTVISDVAAELAVVQRDHQSLLKALPARGQRLLQLAAREEFRLGEVDPHVVDLKQLCLRVYRLSMQLHGIEAAAGQAEKLVELTGQLQSPDDAHTLANQLVALCKQLGGLEAAQQLAQRLQVEPPELGPGELPESVKPEDLEGLASQLETLLGRCEQLHQALAQLPAGDASAAALQPQLIQLLELLSGRLLTLSLIQAGARLDTATLEPIDIEPDEALQIARDYRRDWMNARAALVDVWRQVELAANDLESDLDLVFSGDINTTDNNPVRFRGTTGRLRVGLEFDAPLTRLAERNAYREALINYQRARRQYYTIEDRIAESLRDTIRIIRLNQLNFEVQRASVLVAADRVDEAQERLAEPGGSTLAFNTARDLVEALQALLRAQNDFLRIWVNQEALRMNLDLDLGTMELDGCGLWIDPGPIRGKAAQSGDRSPKPASSEVTASPEDSPGIASHPPRQIAAKG